MPLNDSSVDQTWPTKPSMKFETCPKMTIFPSNDQFSSVLSKALWLQQSLIETSGVWLLAVVDIVDGDCDDHNQTEGRPLAVAALTRQPTTIILAGSLVLAEPGSNWTGGILRHFIGFRYKQDLVRRKDKVKARNAENKKNK